MQAEMHFKHTHSHKQTKNKTTGNPFFKSAKHIWFWNQKKLICIFDDTAYEWNFYRRQSLWHLRLCKQAGKTPKDQKFFLRIFLIRKGYPTSKPQHLNHTMFTLYIHVHTYINTHILCAKNELNRHSLLELNSIKKKQLNCDLKFLFPLKKKCSCFQFIVCGPLNVASLQKETV